MRRETRFVLIDGSEHKTLKSAELHLLNILSKGNDLALFEELASLRNGLQVRDFFVANYVNIVSTMQIVNEIHEVLLENR